VESFLRVLHQQMETDPIWQGAFYQFFNHYILFMILAHCGDTFLKIKLFPGDHKPCILPSVLAQANSAFHPSGVCK